MTTDQPHPHTHTPKKQLKQGVPGQGLDADGRAGHRGAARLAGVRLGGGRGGPQHALS